MYALAEHFMPRCQDGQGYSEDKILACDRPNIFSRIHEKTVEMVIWDRQLPKMMRNWLSTRTWTGLPSGRVLIKPNESEDALSSMLSPLGGSLCKGAELFMADAAQLVNTFSELTNSDLVDVRVDAIRHDRKGRCLIMARSRYVTSADARKAVNECSEIFDNQ